ncbi:MAG: MFS transporter [Clostridia bacterium]|nr:MFS transporter [Clostridia bacterium]
MNSLKELNKRWLYLGVGVFAMLFMGVLYAWSILKVPLKEAFGWEDSALALNFTLTMCFFCIGAFIGSLICKKRGVRFSLIISGVLTGAGFILTGLLTKDTLPLLYVGYALIAGSGIGISYNVIISTVNAWFPDKKGLCSGCLMMGFGVSTLLMGNVISGLFEYPAMGAQKTFIALGILLATVIICASLVLRAPSPDTQLPAPKPARTAKKQESFEARDYTTLEMVKSFTFWRAFVCIAFITAVGNSVISFARDLMLSVDAAPALATTLVGVLSVCNGFGRILTGAVYDIMGRRFTMIASNVLTIFAAGITLIAVSVGSLPLCIVGLCLSGLSYGSCPTVASAFTATFYGQKHFSLNYGIALFHLIGATLIAMVSNSLYISSGSFVYSFIMLLALAVLALGLNLSIKKP